jgi:hypothetical protein
LNHKPSTIGAQKLKQSRHIKILHIIDKTMFIILENHHPPKISELKKSGAEVKI